MGKLFGTDGVRGIYGEFLTDDLAKQLGYFGTKVLSENHKPKIIIGVDTRESAQNLQDALAQGITKAGGEVYFAGVVPTPAIAVLVKKLDADLGIVVSASHNPYQFNGIKFFNNKGFKLPDSVEDEIEEHIFNHEIEFDDVEYDANIIDNAADIYLDFINKEKHQDLSNLKIVIDCSNGALSEIAPKYFENLGAEVITIGNTPNGKNINEGCGSTHIENISQKVKDENADFGLAFDGDADRCLAVDENGNLIDGDQILYLFAKKLREDDLLKNNTLVITEMSNLGLTNALDEQNLNYVRTDVGDRYVLEEMLKNDYNLGGEQSGHVILLDKNTTGDGLLTASFLTDLLASSGKKASENFKDITILPQVLANAKVNNDKKYDYLENKEINDNINKLNDFFDGKGRILIRPSGTEPLVRVMIEGENQNVINEKAHETANLIESLLS